MAGLDLNARGAAGSGAAGRRAAGRGAAVAEPEPGARAYDGVIFDLDGVLCSTDEYHYAAWRAIADELDVPFDHTVNDRLRGVSRMDSLEIILEGFDGTLSQVEKEDLAARKNELYRAGLKGLGPDDVLDGVVDVLEALRAAGVPAAIGSSSKNTPLILKKLGLRRYFAAVVDGNQIKRSKPDPEVFLRAATALGLAPERCLVVEDAEAGAAAAHAGGMDAACVGAAAEAGAGDYNLAGIRELPALLGIAL